MPPPWWDVAFDDHLVARWGHGCTLCATGHLAWAWTRVVHGVAVGICLCERCHARDGQHEAVDALLRQRYDPQRFSHNFPP